MPYVSGLPESVEPIVSPVYILLEFTQVVLIGYNVQSILLIFTAELSALPREEEIRLKNKVWISLKQYRLGL